MHDNDTHPDSNQPPSRSVSVSYWPVCGHFSPSAGASSTFESWSSASGNRRPSIPHLCSSIFPTSMPTVNARTLTPTPHPRTILRSPKEARAQSTSAQMATRVPPRRITPRQASSRRSTTAATKTSACLGSNPGAITQPRFWAGQYRLGLWQHESNSVDRYHAGRRTDSSARQSAMRCASRGIDVGRDALMRAGSNPARSTRRSAVAPLRHPGVPRRVVGTLSTARNTTRKSACRRADSPNDRRARSESHPGGNVPVEHAVGGSNPSALTHKAQRRLPDQPAPSVPRPKPPPDRPRRR